MLRLIDARNGGGLEEIQRLRALLSPQGDVVSPEGKARTKAVFGEPLSPRQVATRICEDVRSRGIDAVLEYSSKLDSAKLTADTLRVPNADFAEAHQSAPEEFLDAVRKIRDSIHKYQSSILHKNVRLVSDFEDLRVVYRPIRRVGICVPGGAAAYPSTLLMTAVPAMAAGVREIAVMAPPTPLGAYNKLTLAACLELGVTEVYRMGGAHGVAALAYGVDGIPSVDMIVGPGNVFVALAKQYVSGTVGIDSFAGPSEVAVLADQSADPLCIAADLIAQAEHSPGSSILVTWSQPVANQTIKEVERQISQISRKKEAAASLSEFGAVILVADEAAGCELVNELAPEHLEILTTNPEATLANIDRAGAVFLGRHSPVAVGDYIAGPSHTLPTGGTARFASVLSANTFLRAMSVVQYSSAQLQNVRSYVRVMAEVEGLTAHARSLDVRFES